MTFSRKVFFAVLITTVVVGAAIILTTYRYVHEQTKESFVSRYSVFSKVLGDTLTRLDTSTESLMLNAAQVLSAMDAEKGVLSTDELKAVRSQLNVTHIFVVNKDGRFIRSTNEDPKLIPNVYSFCSDYKNMIVGGLNSYATPIIHPQPEPKPYKFLFIPNRTRERLIEVGVRVDFVAKTLSEALGSDPNVLSMAVYDPNGTSFGTFTAKEYEFNEKKIDIPTELPAVIDDGKVFKFYTKVASSHPQCCQCDVAGTSKNGEYYYVLESAISKNELSAVMAKTKVIFIFIGLIIVLVSALFGKVLVRRLVRNIEMAASKVRSIRQGENSEARLNIQGNDEVAYLTKEFDGLLDKLEETQAKIIESEKTEAKVQIARQVAHNIRSPIIAIEMMLPMMIRLPDQMKSVLKNSVKEIKALSDKLKTQADSMTFDSTETETMYLPIILRDIIAVKQFEYSDQDKVQIELLDEVGCADAFVKGLSIELKSILSNLINNAVESYGGNGGTVTVRLCCDEEKCSVYVTDNGVGIPAEHLKEMGSRPISFKGSKSRGLGLTHAYKVINEWGGKISIVSEVGIGTTVRIDLQKTVGANMKLKRTAESIL